MGILQPRQVGAPGGWILSCHTPYGVLQALVCLLCLPVCLWVVPRHEADRSSQHRTEGPPTPVSRTVDHNQKLCSCVIHGAAVTSWDTTLGASAGVGGGASSGRPKEPDILVIIMIGHFTFMKSLHLNTQTPHFLLFSFFSQSYTGYRNVHS